MEINTWEKVESIFHIAVELPFEERNPYLQNECAGNGELFSEVESLITSFEKDSHILEEPVFELGLDAIGKKSQKNLANSTIGFYKLEEKIGAGGMGEVYKAVDTRLNRRVALKFLSASLENDNSAKRQLVKEAQAVAMLEHPNICAVHGIEETGEHHFIVMQYIEGKTLGESFKDTPINVEEFKSVTRQILTAVAFAHSHGVIHRDLKPGNIMLTDDGHIKVLDFGLAKIIPQNQLLGSKTGEEVSQFSSNGLVIGTVSYMSPEQLRGKKLDYRSDIFSIGIVLYELLARQNPFNCESQAETIAAILSDEPPALRQYVPDIPAGLINLVEKCLQKKPDDRFQSAAEMLVELDQAETADSVRTIYTRRKKFPVKSAFAAALLYIICSVIFFYNAKRPQRIIAVLPISFDNPPPEKEYLADGLTQSIIDKLSNLSDLKVKNESTVARYKGKVVKPQTAGKELNVDAVFVGSIGNREDGLILTTKLLRTSDGYEIDSDVEKIEEADLIALQEKVAARILDKIKLEINAEDKNKLAKKDTENPEAKQLYIRGRYYLGRREGDDLQNAGRNFREATALDPAYAKAWSGLADTYSLYSVPGHKGSMSPETAVILAKAAAKQAIEIDDSLCEPFVSLGLIKLRYDWNWNEAESEFREAIRRDPEFPSAHLGLSNLLTVKKQFDEAIGEAEKAKEFAPYSVSSYLNMAGVYYFKRDYEQMNRVLSESLEKFPHHKRLSYFRGLLLLETGKTNEAKEIFEQMYQEDKVLAAAPLGLIYGKTGRKEEALKILDALDELSKKDAKNYIPSQEKAIIYLGLGELNKVFENLNKACSEKFPAFPFVINDPIFDEIKSDTRFAAVENCANL